jgi:DNA-binding CsgD family transcriptional regulator
MATNRPPGTHRAETERDHAIDELLRRCDALEPVDLLEIETVLAETPLPDGARSVRAHRLLTPWLIAIGESEAASRWNERDRRASGEPTPDCCDCQINLVKRQLRIAVGSPPEGGTDGRLEPFSITAARWFDLQATYYWELIAGDTATGRRVLDQMAVCQGSIPGRSRDDLWLLKTLCDVVDGAMGIDVAPPTRRITLTDVRSALVAGEAVALGGTRDAARRWNAWFDASWPVHVLRDPAWPVLVQRVRALLASRVGDLQAAKRWMDEAIVVADRIGSPVESALARVQAAELLAFDAQWAGRARRSALREGGRDGCRALGIPHEHHAARAGTAAVLGRFDAMSIEPTTAAPPAELTGREIEVLRLFSAGHSYRQAAEILGVGWRTVQSHAYNAYQKLGVSSKIAAVAAASSQQLL